MNIEYVVTREPLWFFSADTLRKKEYRPAVSPERSAYINHVSIGVSIAKSSDFQLGYIENSY